MQDKKQAIESLQKIFSDWQTLLAQQSIQKLSEPIVDQWSVKNILIHLYSWQLITAARLQAAISNNEPVYPSWAGKTPDQELERDRINQLIAEKYKDVLYTEIYQKWLQGFQNVLDLANQISEEDFQAENKYPWIAGYKLLDVLIGTYNHHKEHYEAVSAAL